MTQANVANQRRVWRTLTAIDRAEPRFPGPFTLWSFKSALVGLVSRLS